MTPGFQPWGEGKRQRHQLRKGVQEQTLVEEDDVIHGGQVGFGQTSTRELRVGNADVGVIFKEATGETIKGLGRRVCRVRGVRARRSSGTWALEGRAEAESWWEQQRGTEEPGTRGVLERKDMTQSQEWRGLKRQERKRPLDFKTGF